VQVTFLVDYFSCKRSAGAKLAGICGTPWDLQSLTPRVWRAFALASMPGTLGIAILRALRRVYRR